MTRDIQHGRRGWGVQGIDIVSMASPITKHAITISRSKDVPMYLGFARDEMLQGRKGPVWLDIPLDVQAGEC